MFGAVHSSESASPEAQRSVGTATWRNPLHPGVLDSELFLEKGDLAVPAVDPGLETNVTVLALGRLGKECGEDVVAQRPYGPGAPSD